MMFINEDDLPPPRGDRPTPADVAFAVLCAIALAAVLAYGPSILWR